MQAQQHFRYFPVPRNVEIVKTSRRVAKSFRLEQCRQSSTRRWVSSGLLRRVVWYKFTDVSEVLDVSINRVHRPDDGGSKQL
jgi:hypothetical protein